MSHVNAFRQIMVSFFTVMLCCVLTVLKELSDVKVIVHF